MIKQTLCNTFQKDMMQCFNKEAIICHCMHIKYFESKLLGLIIHKNNRILVTKANYIKKNVFIWGTYLHS